MNGRAKVLKRLIRCVRVEIRLYERERLPLSRSSLLWNGIFSRFYGIHPPRGPKDPRWDELLHGLRGLRLVSQLLGDKRYR